MPSHVDPMATTTGLNIRGDRGVRDKLGSGSSANSDTAKEWPELIGLEVPRQVRFKWFGIMLTTLIVLHINPISLNSARETGRTTSRRNED
jgi:hypothetical protein